MVRLGQAMDKQRLTGLVEIWDNGRCYHLCQDGVSRLGSWVSQEELHIGKGDRVGYVEGGVRVEPYSVQMPQDQGIHRWVRVRIVGTG